MNRRQWVFPLVKTMSKRPKYVDLQVNGFRGIDFNCDQLQSQDVACLCQQLRDDNVVGILATVISDDICSMCRRLTRIREIRDANPLVADVIWGIHIEGPFINEQPGFIGAHLPCAARWADSNVMDRLLDAAGDLVRIVTLAPERDAKCKVTRMLANRGIRVAAGHCDPSIDQLRAAIDAGLSMFTHLGNGCPLVMHRHDNIIQRVLSLSDHLWIGFIADGVHVPIPALRNYLRLVGVDHSFVVTDAIHAAGNGPGTYRFVGQTVIVDDHLATWDEQHTHLVGSASTMSDAVTILRDGVGLSEPEIERLTYANPSKIISSNGYGRDSLLI